MTPTDKKQFNDAAEARAELSRVLAYDPDTGLFAWRVYTGKITPGAPAGTTDFYGYVDISYRGKKYKAHRLAWLFVHGDWPKDQIDHIDGNRANNRIGNLREANHSQNMTNAIKRRNKHALPRGVKRGTSAWLAATTVKGKHVHIGSFQTIEEASAAFQSFSRNLRGEFHYSRDKENTHA